MTTVPPITIRRATPCDRPAVVRVAQRDSARVPAGELLVAELDGVVIAALALAGGAVVADPFRPAAEAVALLRVRARALGGTPADSGPHRGLLRHAATPATGR